MAVKRTVNEICDRCGQIDAIERFRHGRTEIAVGHRCLKPIAGPQSPPRAFAEQDVIFVPETPQRVLILLDADDAAALAEHMGSVSPTANIGRIVRMLQDVAMVSARERTDGKWLLRRHTNVHSSKSTVKTDADLIDIFTSIGEALKVELETPGPVIGPACTCPKTCDCQDYAAGLMSQECPIHNERPAPAPGCPMHG